VTTAALPSASRDVQTERQYQAKNTSCIACYVYKSIEKSKEQEPAAAAAAFWLDNLPRLRTPTPAWQSIGFKQ
jgi:hypothetical protein